MKDWISRRLQHRPEKCGEEAENQYDTIRCGRMYMQMYGEQFTRGADKNLHRKRGRNPCTDKPSQTEPDAHVDSIPWSSSSGPKILSKIALP